MVGCPAGCSFCATGALGFRRNLSRAEIVGQVLVIAKSEGVTPREIRNVVLMGMGEALLNYDNALGAIRTLIDPNACGFSPRRITLSTVGFPSKIERLAQEGLPLVLAVSLHAPDDETRMRIIPTAHAYPISEILQSLRTWQHSVGRRITIEYTMLHGVNDSGWQAELLARRLRGLQVHINLIPFNPWPQSGFKVGTPKQLEDFKDILEGSGLAVSIRFSRGQDSAGACGQLALTRRTEGNHIDDSRPFP
jgi:23S rRNA (adenine2503-C2)-methyltransferase